LLVLNFEELKFDLNSDTPLLASLFLLSVMVLGLESKQKLLRKLSSPLGLSSKLLFTMQELNGWSRRWW